MAKEPDSAKFNRKRGLGRVPGKQRVTMQDIARVAGCSQSTVSFVLNASTSVKISERTRKRVLDVARDLGYQPASLPGLKRNRPTGDGAIAFVIDKISTSPEGIVALDGVRQMARDLGAVVLVAETDNDPVLEPKTLEMFIEMGVQAIIYACIFTREVELPNALVETSVPTVLLNCYSRDGERPAVVPGEVAGGHRATERLLREGHHRIGTITGEGFMEATRDRLRGYRNALATADVPFSPDLVVEGDWSTSAGYQGTQDLMKLPNPPTAIFCQNDRMAVGCYEALKELGLRIPEDISVIGFDDEEIARHLSPPLTTLILPHRAMGRWAVEQIISGPATVDRFNALVKLECELVERDSIAPPPAD